VFYIEFNNG